MPALALEEACAAYGGKRTVGAGPQWVDAGAPVALVGPPGAGQKKQR
jgi:ABC-type branched-subunit amino acid transport system ATPase component